MLSNYRKSAKYLTHSVYTLDTFEKYLRRRRHSKPVLKHSYVRRELICVMFAHFDGQYRSKPRVSLRGASKQASALVYHCLFVVYMHMYIL